MRASPVELLATSLLGLAVLHTFCVRRFAHWAHQYPAGSVRRRGLSCLAETEVVFGLWATVLLIGIAVIQQSVAAAVHYVSTLDYTQAEFVWVIMVVAATRPVVQLAETLLWLAARLIPVPEGLAFYIAALSLGPLLGSFITEPAAMTLLALVLQRRYFDRGISPKLAYATLGLLFVNVSIGGTLTPFAAPPVLMVAAKWHWNLAFMFQHFGWRAAAAGGGHVPVWLTGLHLGFLTLVVACGQHPDLFVGVGVVFLGLTTVTRPYQDELKLREGLLVGVFLAGLVTLGSLQDYWLQPLLQSLDGNALFYGATGLTALIDNAALTYLGSLGAGLPDEMKYALVAGAVTGGGLTVIANAPNPVGVGILRGAKVFQGDGISPWGLFLGALLPTTVAIGCFWLLR